MSLKTAQIGVVGAGPAGSHLAWRLVSAGYSVVLFDPKGAWEKPCGGGVPARAIREFPFLLEEFQGPKQLVRRITIISPSESRVKLELSVPFAVYSRRVFNGQLLDRAIEAGTEFIREGVADFVREDGEWRIRTSASDSDWRVRLLVGADGAASTTRRRLVGVFPVRDLAIALGHNVQANAQPPAKYPADEVVVRFLRNFTGYLWAFPRQGVINFGVASKLAERTSAELRSLLSEFIRDYYNGKEPPPESTQFFGAKIPTLDVSSWKDLRASGDGWALIGDAAGFADPITGEGIFYALKSAELLAQAIRETALPGATDYLRAVTLYETRWRESFGSELRQASYRLPQFYHGRFFGLIMTDAVVRFARVHKGIRHVLINALMGEQSYVTLKRDLLRRALQFF
jgi:geranylgeranyl reductase family protein